MIKTLQIQIQSFSDTDPEICEKLLSSKRKTAKKDGRIYLYIGETVFSCAEDDESRLLLNTICCEETDKNWIPSETDCWRSILSRCFEREELSRYGISVNTPRAVVLLRPNQYIANSEIIPLEETDKVISMDNGDFVLILNMQKRSSEEIEEFAYAVTETLESEAGISCLAGIGRTAETIDSLPDAFSDAKEAIRNGIRHRLPGRVFIYSRQAIERLADMIPRDDFNQFRKYFFPPGTEKVLTDEMLETIRSFFQNDLNLSITARELYIHRNTLLYRMEKIRKATGLDLRKFEDAAVFRFMMCISDTQE